MAVLVYVCQACGLRPKLDYDYSVLDMCGQARGWYCSKCGARCCQMQMNGAIAVYFRDRIKDGFVARIAMPD